MTAENAAGMSDSNRCGWATGAIAAIVCAAISLGGLLLLPQLADADLRPPGLTLLTPDTWRWWVLGVVLLVQSAALLWAWREPRIVFGVVVLLAVPGALFGPGPDVHLTTPALVVAMYTVAASEPVRRTVVLAICAATVTIAADSLSGIDGDPSVLVSSGALIAVPQAALALIPPVLLAVFVRSRRELRDALVGRLDAVERERAAVVRAAIAQERTSMARELHDVAAHHLSGIAIMAAAVEGMIDGDPDAAKTSVREIRTQSRSLLANLRQVVGLLRTDDAGTGSDGDGRPASLAGIPDLVEQMGRRHVEVDLDVITDDGTGVDALSAADGIGPLAQIAAFRMVQEALANATLHAPGARCRVVVDTSGPDVVTVTVRNGPAEVGPFPSRRSGLGLVGMQERATLTGATLEYGPTSDHGWMVSMSLPRDHQHGGHQPDENQDGGNGTRESTA